MFSAYDIHVRAAGYITRMGEFKNVFWFIMISVGVDETNQKLLGSSDRSWASDVFPMESESWQALNWTRLASLNFTRLVKATKKVAESHSVEVIFAQNVEHSENNSEFVGSLFKKIGPIILTVRNATSSQEPRAKLAIVIVDEELDVWDLVIPNGTDDLWTSTKYYVLVTAAVPPNVLELFRTLWDVYFVSNVLLYATDGKEVVNVYNPFKNSTEVTSIHMRNIGRIKKMMVHRMNDLNGYPLRVSIFPARMKATPLGNGSYSGPDGFILSTLARRMNFKPVTSEPKDGKKYGYKTPNGSFTGTLGDLINDRADISFNSVFIKDYETTQVRFTRPIDFDKLCLVVAKSGLRPHWKGMFLAFSVEMWLAMLFTYSFSITFWCLLRKVNYGRYSLALTTLDLYRIFIMLPIDRVPAILSERVALVSFLWFSLSTATIFQASMVKFLSYPSYEPDIDTLEEVADKNLPILTASQNLRETFESDEPVMKTLYDNFQVVHDKNVEILSKVAYEGKAAALGRMNDLEEKIATSYVKNNLVLLHIVADCPKAYHIAYMLPYDSPFLASINKVISIFVESGIIHSWYIHSTPFRPLSDYHQTQETYKPLTMSNVVIAFIVLGFGAGLSFLAFGAELLTRALLGDVTRVQPQLQYSFDGHLARRSRLVYETTKNRIGSDKPLKFA